MDYKLRPALETERDVIFDTYRTTVGLYVKDAWGWDEKKQKEGFWIHHPVDEFQVIETDNQFAGGIHIKEDNNDIYIKMVFLLAAYQKKGIGSKLITDIQNLSRTKGKGLRLKVIKSNPALNLYQNLGFKIEYEDESSVDMRWVY